MIYHDKNRIKQHVTTVGFAKFRKKHTVPRVTILRNHDITTHSNNPFQM